MDTVYLNDLVVEAIIGIHPWEREVPQRLVLQLEVGIDVAASDDIGHTVDYSALAERVRDHIRDRRYRLLETLAEETAAMIRQEFGVDWLRLQVGKPGAVTTAREVGVQIERGNRT